LILARNREMTRELLAFSREQMIRHGFVRGDPKQGEDIGQLSMERIAEQIATLVELKILPKPIEVTSVATTEFIPQPQPH
jgi:hypothetical protein